LATHGAGVAIAPRPVPGLLWHFVETTHIARDIYRQESIRALYKGLGPTLVGVIPARSINFFTYGNGKQVIAQKFNDGHETTLVHLSAAALAGIITTTCTNPIWVVKTRLQLAQDLGSSSKSVAGGSLTTIRDIFKQEGIRGFYKGMSASYLGVTEGAIQWTLYERLKKLTGSAEGKGGAWESAGMIISAGAAKCVASLITYPHEVVRTRLRQPLVNGKMKYTGLIQTFRLVLAEEGSRALYGGLSAHLMRVIPNAAVMYSVYEAALRL
jgi:solute carrier family 25 protein 33/36